MTNLDAKLIKKTFKNAFPEIKFSVRQKIGGMLEALYITYTGNITCKELMAFANKELPLVQESLIFYKF